MVLADLGRKITSALQSLSKATVINEEVSESKEERKLSFRTLCGWFCHNEFVTPKIAY